MKKLFSSLLAATMVAGMSVSAFAGTKAANITNNDNDFGLIGAYTDEGGKLQQLNKNNKIDGGDKLYFPILVSGEELLDQKDGATEDGGAELKDNDMYFATKASEVKSLKASVKDEIGGKYIDSASIVKKDIKIDKSGNQVVKPEAATEATFDLTIGNTLTANTSADGSKKYDLKLTVGGENIIIKDIVDTENLSSADKIAQKFVGKSTTKYDVTSVSGAKISFKAKSAGQETAPTGVATLTIETATDSGNDGNHPTLNTAVDNKISNSVDGKKAIAGTVSDAIAKIYCVEVKMSDYFKPEETEVEFNIKLKDGGKVAFDTDDDKLEGNGFFFNGTFDLGRDTKTLSAKDKDGVDGVEVKKFKKGDLEILIGKDTRSVQLDEAYLSDGKTKEDITNIYIENDKTIDNTFTFDVKASSQDDLYLELNQDANKDIATANPKADLIFFNFPGNPEFDFSGDATFAVEDEDADNYFYEIVKGELVETKAKYNEEDGVFELRTNKLGSYVISDKELETAKEDEDVKDTEDKGNEQAGGDASEDATPNNNGGKSNANTGAADLIGVASALAVVSVAAAGAVALKK